MLSKLSLTLSVAAAGKCPFGYDTPSNDSASNPHPKVRSTAAYPSDIFTCPSNGGFGIATTTSAFDKAKYKEIVAEVVAQYEAVDATVAANNNPRAKYAGCIVRTGGHDFMDFRIAADGTTSGGSDGCINFADADNTGLADCLENSGLIGVF